MGWRHKITPKADAMKLIKPNHHLEISYQSKPGFHIIADGGKVVCRISKSTAKEIKGEEIECPFINVGKFKINLKAD
jgi:hypothetical protein